MSKRQFRPSSSAKSKQPTYPTLDDFDQGRRTFLTRLGAALIGASTLATIGCGNRPLTADPDAGHQQWAGGAPMPDGRIDQQIQVWDNAGIAPSRDARIDQRDSMPVPGEPPLPDARIDQQDGGIIAGGAPMPDAEIDKKDMGPFPGSAPNMDARVDDGGS